MPRGLRRSAGGRAGGLGAASGALRSGGDWRALGGALGVSVFVGGDDAKGRGQRVAAAIGQGRAHLLSRVHARAAIHRHRKAGALAVALDVMHTTHDIEPVSVLLGVEVDREPAGGELGADGALNVAEIGVAVLEAAALTDNGSRLALLDRR